VCDSKKDMNTAELSHAVDIWYKYHGTVHGQILEEIRLTQGTSALINMSLGSLHVKHFSC
jgi:hypothetical protein